jgi:hypothetical protein
MFCWAAILSKSERKFLERIARAAARNAGIAKAAKFTVAGETRFARASHELTSADPLLVQGAVVAVSASASLATWAANPEFKIRGRSFRDGHRRLSHPAPNSGEARKASG